MSKWLWVLALSFGFAVAGPLQAQEQRYQAWPSEPDDNQSLIDALRPLIDDAERSRAADPRFLSDLRAVLRRFDYEWRVRILSEDFRDGDFTRNPVWTIAQGEFYMARGGGLLSEASGAPAIRTGQPTRNRDVVAGILGRILEEALDDDDDDGQQTSQSRPAETGEIYLPVSITPAFAITAEVIAAEAKERFDLSVYMGGDRQTRYRLSLVPGAGVELLRESNRGASIIDSRRDPSILTLNEAQLVVWRRSADGLMTVEVNGQTLLEVTDRAFRDSFSGFALTNRGGAYILRTLIVDGTR
jgi:hypothetical protein